MQSFRPQRRHLLKGAAAVAAAGTAGCATTASGPRQIAGYEPRLTPSAGTLGGWLQKLHNFGPIRATGTAQCRAFEEFLASEFTRLGATIERDQFKLTSWECDLTDCSITVREDSGATRTLDVVAYYPFGGSTAGKAAVSGRIVYGGSGENSGPAIVARIPAAELAGSIVVVEMPLAGGGVRGTVQYYPPSFPNPLPQPVTAPRVASQGGRGPMAALENLCKGVILCYTDVSNEAARYNYLPFSDQHRKIPGLWVGKADTDYLKAVSGKAVATMRCDARLTPNARADSLVATMKGASNEVIFLTTHTDGPNEVNDNGALGLLAIATYFAKAKPKRTLVFCLPTGHYAGGAIRDPVTGSGTAAGTGGVMAKRPEVIARTVGQLQLEQMAAMEWADVGGKWQPTGRPAPENWIPTPAMHDTINRLFMACTVGEDPKWSRSGLVESGQAPGEGGGLRSRGIPGIGLMGSPHYFFRADPKGVIDKLNPRLMKNQVNIATKMVVLMDRLSAAQLKGTAPITEADLFGV